MNLENYPIAFKVEMQMKSLENKGVNLKGEDYNRVGEAFYKLYRELSEEDNKIWADWIIADFKSGAEWQKQQPLIAAGKINQAIEWCDEQIKESFCRDAPVATTLKEYPYVEMKQFLQSIKS